MVKYKILIDFLCLLAMAVTCLGCYYTITSGVGTAITVLVFSTAVVEVFIDLCVIVKVTNTRDI